MKTTQRKGLTMTMTTTKELYAVIRFGNGAQNAGKWTIQVMDFIPAGDEGIFTLRDGCLYDVTRYGAHGPAENASDLISIGTITKDEIVACLMKAYRQNQSSTKGRTKRTTNAKGKTMTKSLRNRMTENHGREEGNKRADILERSHAEAEQLAAGIEPLSFVAVVVREQGAETIQEGFVNREHRLQIGGVYGHVVTKLASRPYCLVGGDDWTIAVGGVRAVLADGTKVRMHGAGNVRQVIAGGNVYRCVMDAAVDITPAI